MSDIVQEPIVVVSYPSQVKVKLFNRWSFDDVQSIFTALFARLTQIKVQLDKESPESSLVLLDARNLNGTMIGKFHSPIVETLVHC
ncbi:hypothetical protein P8452_28431 [Trifolium repens]|nr:hypothetical protein P8452_28431 [Trifolium repens]